MGANSTIRVTKTAARKYLLAKVMEATSDELSEMLDGFLAERLYNTHVVEDGGANDDMRTE